MIEGTCTSVTTLLCNQNKRRHPDVPQVELNVPVLYFALEVLVVAGILD